MSPAATIVPLDLRHLPPPEPMQRILDALETLPPGACLQALTPHRPEPLLPVLAQWGCAWRIQALPGGGAWIAVCHAGDEAALEAAVPPAVARPASGPVPATREVDTPPIDLSAPAAPGA